MVSPIARICLPYSDTPIVTQLGRDRFTRKPPCPKGWGAESFNVWFLTHGDVTKFAITLTDTGFLQSVNVRRLR